MVRIRINDKHVNIGRYKTEEEAREMFLKGCVLLGYDEISIELKDMIKEYNIHITEEDYNNKYINKIIALRDTNKS